MNKEKRTLTQVGWLCEGEATLQLWGGGTGTIPMKPWRITELTDEKILAGINDNGFGCEAIIEASVEISIDFGLFTERDDFNDKHYTEAQLTNAQRGIAKRAVEKVRVV